MTMKRYQIALLFFALGISLVTFILGFVFKRALELDKQQVAPTPKVEDYAIIQVFFSSKTDDPDTLYCDKTYPVERAVSRLTDNERSGLAEYAYLALSELLKGPVGYEKDNGYFTSINEGAKVREIILENNIATVDFNEELSRGVAGSCRVQAVRSQIEQTLKQFPEIKEVVISINGNSEEILQP